jgi:hypothetical protein
MGRDSFEGHGNWEQNAFYYYCYYYYYDYYY